MPMTGVLAHQGQTVPIALVGLLLWNSGVRISYQLVYYRCYISKMISIIQLLTIYNNDKEKIKY